MRQKEVAAMVRDLKHNYGMRELPQWVFEAGGRIRIATKDAMQAAKKMRAIKSTGVALTGEEGVLTIEGAQLLSDRITKNVLEIRSRHEAEKIAAGEPLELKDLVPDGHYAIRFGKDWLGTGVVDSLYLIPTIPEWRLAKRRTSEAEQ